MRQGMTAFSRVEIHTKTHHIQVEMRSVNHRYLDMSPRIQDAFRPLEALMRAQLQKQFKRGRIDFWVTVESVEQNGQFVLNDDAIQAWMQQLQQDQYAHLGMPDWSDILRLPGVLDQGLACQLPNDDAIMAAFSDAMAELVAMRQKEGTAMAAVISERLTTVQAVVAAARAHYAQAQVQIEQQLRDQCAALCVEVDHARFEQELLLLLGKADVTEELDRLDFHVQQTQEALAKEGAVGRRLDFLMQEFNREANTLASKACDTQLSRTAVELKVLIEQMREQVQNIE